MDTQGPKGAQNGAYGPITNHGSVSGLPAHFGAGKPHGLYTPIARKCARTLHSPPIGRRDRRARNEQNQGRLLSELDKVKALLSSYQHDFITAEPKNFKRKFANEHHAVELKNFTSMKPKVADLGKLVTQMRNRHNS